VVVVVTEVVAVDTEAAWEDFTEGISPT